MKGSHIINRPDAATIKAVSSNDYVHYDYLFVGESLAGPRYILVAKD